MKKTKQYILVGYPFAGKTTLAKEIEKRLNFKRYNVDELKEEFGYSGITDDKIPDDIWIKIFKELDLRIENTLRKGETVINEYAWVTKEWRDRAKDIGNKVGIESKIIFLDIPENIVRKRWLENKKNPTRFDVSEVDFEEAIETFEKPTSDEKIINYKYGDTINEFIEKLNKS